MVSRDFWSGRRVLVTGHTGFKGSWLALWLNSLGAETHGIALEPPTRPSLYEAAAITELLESDERVDIRDAAAVTAALHRIRPEIVIHLAAQSLVRASYDFPLETYATNVMGTAHVLNALRDVDSVRVAVSVTTDKVYENFERPGGYREDEPLGGYDPYSSSKAAAELVTAALRRSFLADRGIAVASARAGNVIGGGDWAADRLVPDALTAFSQGRPVEIRNPEAVRPWQHVLEPLSGYLLLAERLSDGGQEYAEAWNFGPDADDALPVRAILERLAQLWGDGASWVGDTAEHPHEAGLLGLDASKAHARLGWRPRWAIQDALAATVNWQREFLAGKSARETSLEQIAEYEAARPVGIG
ncbi:MAG: CDP-glucose 4,6-dehydratase [Rhodoglobus sp.]